MPRLHLDKNPALRYLLPFLVLSLGSYLQSQTEGQAYFVLYIGKILLSSLAFVFLFRTHWREIEGSFDLKAVGVGLIALLIWIVPLSVGAQPLDLGKYDPALLNSTMMQWFVIAFRIFAASLVIPLIEETLWRSFLMRYFIEKDFLKVKLGTYAHLSFWLTALSFAFVHSRAEWGVALVVGILYGAYLVKTKNLVGCIIAHGVTNLGLGIYVVITQQWGLWG